jgi:dTDP-glucose 4,6-dehydratase
VSLQTNPDLRALVTGGAGFIGSHLCERLIGDGAVVVSVDNLLTGSATNLDRLKSAPTFLSMHADLIDRDSVGKITGLGVRFTHVLHLACPASPIQYSRHPIETLQVGSIGTLHALEVARLHGAAFMLASTSEVYGDPAVSPQPESYWGNVNSVGPRSMYDEAKRFSEALAVAYWRSHGVDVRIARIFNTYGPRMQLDDGRVIPTFVVQALTGQPLTIYGDGAQTRSFCYVDDLVEGLVRLSVRLNTQRGSLPPIVNLGNPEELTVRKVAEEIIELTGSSSSMTFVDLPGDDPKRRCPDVSRARVTLSWEPSVSFRRGIIRTIPYFRRAIGLRGSH